MKKHTPSPSLTHGSTSVFVRTLFIKMWHSRDAWGVQSVKRPTLGFGSDRDQVVRALLWALWWQCRACLGFSFSLSLSAPPLLALSLSKYIKKKKKWHSSISLSTHIYRLFTYRFFLNVYSFLRDRDRMWVEEGQRERERLNPKQAPGSQLSAQSPMPGSNPRTVRSWPEAKSDA